MRLASHIPSANTSFQLLNHGTMCHSILHITGIFITSITVRGEPNYSNSFKGVLEAYSHCDLRVLRSCSEWRSNKQDCAGCPRRVFGAGRTQLADKPRAGRLQLGKPDILRDADM